MTQDQKEILKQGGQDLGLINGIIKGFAVSRIQ
jgi:hypothetical protein